jgi:superfamily I DNA/RNA helicase
MALHPSVADRLARLAPDQRAAATAAPGPVLCIAPAGSGKTTTLVARVAWLVASGTAASTITAIAFNRRAAEELTGRLDAALSPLGVRPRDVTVRTFHALGREILAQSGVAVDRLVDRDEVLRRLFPAADLATRRRLDTGFSRLKLDLGVMPDEVAGDPDAGPTARAWLAYESALRETGSLDFDDLVARAVRLLEREPRVLGRWRASSANLLVDEVQDLDRCQLRMALLLAAPANRIFMVGDDDQSVYGWRLADVRRVLSLADRLPGLRRVDLEVNYRCPRPVVERAVRLVSHNRERFAKTVRAAPAARGRLVLAPDLSEDTTRIRRVLGSWPDDDGIRAILARTNRELLPAAAVALDLGLPFRSPPMPWPLESPYVDELLAAALAEPATGVLARLGRVRDTALARQRTGGPDEDQPFTRLEIANALLAWAARVDDLDGLVTAIEDQRGRLATLRRDDAPLVLATAHGTKGLEFDHVAVLADGFPGHPRDGTAEPERMLEEERRLAYVAWTRARRSLTLVYDPAAPSSFPAEAFSAEELALEATVAA